MASTKRRMWRRLAWFFPLLLFFLVVEFSMMGKAFSDVLPVVLPVLALLLPFGLFLGFRSQLERGKVVWNSYDVTLSANVIRRQVTNLPPVEILRPEVVRIVETGEGVTVATRDRHRFIFIPEQLIGYEDLRAHLAQWRNFEPPGATNRLFSIGWTVLTIGSWIGTGVLRDIRLAMISGAVLFAVTGIAIRETLKTKIADSRSKASAIRAMAFLLLAPIARLILYFCFHMNIGWPHE
jgi:hypothetical protein